MKPQKSSKNAPARKKFNETAKILKKIAPARKKFNETAKIMKKIAPARKKFDETARKKFEKTGKSLKNDENQPRGPFGVRSKQRNGHSSSSRPSQKLPFGP